ncbi:hypothetical protein [Mucilaginibacter glaciei]|uniref:Lipoprotein n=1 Tax=Mucilaginibacter glaciei TaxID=2772109 RepID=A0A926NJX1_9SPHI|nr:hypothetical protein [Mucilaginibacter glaciei]MBD1393434.1 hypothetical protein [Mucilaginibacter glaciei]
MKKTLIVISLFITACTPARHPAAIQIKLINNKHSIEFKGLDYAVMQEIGRDSSSQEWQSLVPVYRMPRDTDMKNYQSEQPGRYELKDSSVVFTPDTPFVAGQVYFVRNYRLGEGATLADYLKGRTQPGRTYFTDLIFKQ